MNMRQEPAEQPQPGVAPQRDARRRAAPAAPLLLPADALSATLLLAGGAVDPGGQQDRQDRAADEDQERVAQRPLRPERRRASTASGAEIAAPATPASEIRELALTRLSSAGSSRGTAAARVTPYALDATRHAERRGEQRRPTRRRRRRRAPSTGTPRIAIVAPIAQRRPWLNRSRNGPISGATTANGSIVSPRNSATCPRAWSVGTWKNSVPASEIATAASPAALNACSSISRDSPLSPAPSAWVARRACRTVNPAARPVAAPARRAPRRSPRAARRGVGRPAGAGAEGLAPGSPGAAARRPRLVGPRLVGERGVDVARPAACPHLACRDGRSRRSRPDETSPAARREQSRP